MDKSTAFFIENPRRLDSLFVPHLIKQEKPYAIEQRVTLVHIDYVNFITDLCVDRWFIEKYTDISRVDEQGIWHCILVQEDNKTDGVLIMSDGFSYPRWAAYEAEIG